MTDIEKVLQELLESHGFTTNTHSYYYHNNHLCKLVHITNSQVELKQWDTQLQPGFVARSKQNWYEIIIDLCDPNSIQIIEDWAKEKGPT